MRSPLWPLVVFGACALTSARAASLEYTVSVPDGRDATFEVPITVEHTGSLTIDASWTGPRLLFFGVEGPGHASLSRRSGPSPQRITIEVDRGLLTGGTGFKLTIKALPARGEAEGVVRVTVPDSPEIVARREAELHPPPPPPPPPPAWAIKTPAPTGAGADVARVYASVETFRATVLPVTDGSPDACSWQIDFLKYAVAARDAQGASGRIPDVPTLRYFARLSAAIRNVDMLRTATGPVIAGPVPADREERRDWQISRNEIVRPIERSLDELTELLRRGHAPALVDEPWLPRLNACLTACERFYDERVRFGGDENAPNGELAGAQWTRILAASAVFESWAPFLKEPQSPDR
jgi:hypothetical protein